MIYQDTFQQSEPLSQTFLSCFSNTGGADSTFLKHCHSYYEISYIIKGTRYETLNQNRYKAESRSLIFVPPLTIHSMNNITQVEDIVIQFDHLFISNSSKLFKKNFMLRPVDQQQNRKIKESDNIYNILSKIYDVCKKKDDLTGDDELSQQEKIKIDIKINCLCLELIYALIAENKIFIDVKNEMYSERYSDLKEINLLINEIISNPNKIISMRKACRIVGMSYSHFSRTFKKVVGFNYVEFCNLLRIHNAEELLLTTDMTISEIAEIVGIKTIAYFTRLFKQTNGNLPSNFKKNNTIEK